jgi:hypothetical protein
MRLTDWLNSLAPGELPRLCKKHHVRVAHFYEARGMRKRGSKRPAKPRPVRTAALALRMSAVTGGAVSAVELMGIEAHQSTEAA